MNRSDELEQRHRQVWDLIPWVVNGSASEGERGLVEQHVLRCRDCATELGFQRQVHRAMAQDGGPELNHAPALRRLWQRIDAPDAGRPWQRKAAAVAPRWPWRLLAAAVLVQSIGLGVLGAMLWMRGSARGAADGAYQTLSSTPAAPARATLRAVFAPDVTEREMQAVLEHSKLQIVGGPSDAGVFSLAPLTPGGGLPTAQVLARLRAETAVRFAEPLPLAGAPP